MLFLYLRFVCLTLKCQQIVIHVVKSHLAVLVLFPILTTGYLFVFKNFHLIFCHLRIVFDWGKCLRKTKFYICHFAELNWFFFPLSTFFFLNKREIYEITGSGTTTDNHFSHRFGQQLPRFVVVILSLLIVVVDVACLLLSSSPQQHDFVTKINNLSQETNITCNTFHH